MPGVYSKRYTGKISLDNVSALKMIAIDPERINSKVVSMDGNELTKTSD
jgi:hypothetical protein